MIRIGSADREMDARFLRAPGGFAWWYVDLLTPDGDGLVLIWSYGLPFLPGYASRARLGRPELPTARPSVNVVVYRRGRPSFYLLQEYADPDGAGALPGASPGSTILPPVLRIGDSEFRSWREDGRQRVEATLDCAVPGSSQRLTGTVRVDGVARRPDGDAEEADAPHVWTPLTGPATGTATLDWGDQSVARLRGRAYHDRNGGAVPLHDLGIRHWIWGRFPLRDRELICYLLWPEHARGSPRVLGLTIDAAGRTEAVGDLRAELGPERRGFAGLRWPERFRLLRGDALWAEVRHAVVVDQGPFYLRFQSEARTGDGERALGWGELCRPDAVDRARHRPLVRMRVHRPAARNSLWLPLFTGPRSGRAGRLLRALLPGSSA